MKKVTISIVALLFAATSVMANTPAKAKKVNAQVTCKSCPKGQKCSKATCADPDDCCK